MRRPLGLGLLGGALLALAIAVPAAAGGWASVVDDEALPPDDSGTTLIRFTLLQHGETPVDWGALSVVAVHEESGLRVTGTASPESATPGDWVAAFQLPEAGGWVLEIAHQDLEITSSAPVRLTSAPLPAAPPADPVPMAGWLGLVLLLLAIALPAGAAAALNFRRGQHRPAAARGTSATTG